MKTNAEKASRSIFLLGLIAVVLITLGLIVLVVRADEPDGVPYPDPITKLYLPMVVGNPDWSQLPTSTPEPIGTSPYYTSTPIIPGDISDPPVTPQATLFKTTPLGRLVTPEPTLFYIYIPIARADEWQGFDWSRYPTATPEPIVIIPRSTYTPTPTFTPAPWELEG